MQQEDNFLEVSQQLQEYGLPVQQSSYRYEDLLSSVSSYINDLIADDFSKLVQLLYRLDINEDQLRDCLKESISEPTSKKIAALIIERQQEKLQLRKSFTRNTNIHEDERW